jgi:hypothetical protein
MLLQGLASDKSILKYKLWITYPNTIDMYKMETVLEENIHTECSLMCHVMFCTLEKECVPSGFVLCSLSLGSDSREALDSLMQRSPSDDFDFTVPRDPYLSPYWASDEVLKQLPPTKIVVSVRRDKEMYLCYTRGCICLKKSADWFPDID